MLKTKHHSLDWPSIKTTLQWCGLCISPAILSGILTLIVMRIVDKEQVFRSANPWLYLLLPVGAISIYLFQRRFPQKSLPFTLQDLHQVPNGSPRYGVPFIVASTLITHLFGGSIGREGSNFQAGATIGHDFGVWYGQNAPPQRTIVASAIAAAFAVLFGTPVAAALFALELTRVEKFPVNAIAPSLVGSLTGIGISALAGQSTTQFKYVFSNLPATYVNGPFHADAWLFVIALVVGIIMGALSCVFTEASIQLRYLSSWLIQPRWVAPITACIVMAVLAYFTPARNYMGLGIIPAGPGDVSIIGAFRNGSIPFYSWLIKLAVTLLCMVAGFRGGELVPLLCIGVLLGHSLFPLAGVTPQLICSLAFVSIFAAAANTPIAAILLSAELFGSQYLVCYTFCILIAYFLSPPTKTPGMPLRHGIPKFLSPRHTTSANL